MNPEVVARVLWQDFPPFPKTVFGSLVSGVSPLLDIPGTAQIHNLSSDVYLSKWHPLLLKNPLKDGGIGSEKYVNIPSEKYIYVHKYVYMCIYIPM